MKREVFLILEGRALVLEFDDEGRIVDTIILDRSKCNFGAEIPAGKWHTVIALEKSTVIFECKDGPYDPATDKEFATWAPAERDENCPAYNAGILNKLNIIQE